MNTAITEAELNLLSAVSRVASTEGHLTRMQDDYDKAAGWLQEAEDKYAAAVVTLVQARAAINAPRQSVDTADPPTTGSVPE